MNVIPGNRELILKINTVNILNLIKNYGPVSRTTIAQKVNLSLATVCKITNYLIEADLVCEIGEGESSGGRKPVLFKINYNGYYVVGIKLSEKLISVALTNLGADILYKKELYFDSKNSIESLVEKLTESYEIIVADSGLKKEKILGLGLGIPGHVDKMSGVCRYSGVLGWKDIPLRKILEETLGICVIINNDVNTLTVAEKWFGAGSSVADFVVVTVGSGIGCGVVTNGNLYYGYSGAAGEFGHIKVTGDGPICECGKKGCLEALAAEPAIVRRVTEAIALGEMSDLKRILCRDKEITIRDIIQAAKAGDNLAKRIYHSAGTYLGIGIANLVNIINPQRVIVSGEGLRAGELLTDPMIAAFRENCFPSITNVTELIIEPLGDDAWARGAASLVIEEIFKAPKFVYMNGKLKVILQST